MASALGGGKEKEEEKEEEEEEVPGVGRAGQQNKKSAGDKGAMMTLPVFSQFRKCLFRDVFDAPPPQTPPCLKSDI